MFAVVNFEKENTYSVVPAKWICGGLCSWPETEDEIKQIR